MYKQLLLSIIVFLTFNQSILSQNEHPQYSIGETFSNDLNHFLELGVGFVKAPAYFSAQDWYKAGATAGGTLILFSVDKNIRTFAQSNQTELNDKM